MAIIYYLIRYTWQFPSANVYTAYLPFPGAAHAEHCFGNVRMRVKRQVRCWDLEEERNLGVLLSWRERHKLRHQGSGCVCVNERERLKGEEREKRTTQGRKKGENHIHSINLLQELAS